MSEEKEYPKILEIISLIRDFHKNRSTVELKRFMSEKSIFKSLNIQTKELQHSQFIAWMLGLPFPSDDPCNPIALLMSLYAYRAIKQGVGDHKELFSDFLNGTVRFLNYNIKTEKSVKGGRVDIVVHGSMMLGEKLKSFNIIIENKVASHEHGCQTETYYKSYSGSKTKDQLNFFIMLCPLSVLQIDSIVSGENEICSCKSFAVISYDDIQQTLIPRLLSSDRLSERERFFINEYVKTLSEITISEDIYMGLDKTTQDIVKKFWEENQDTISIVVDLLQKMETNSEVKENLKIIQNALPATSKDYSRYSINGSGTYNKSEAVAEAVKIILESYIRGGKIRFQDALNKFNVEWGETAGKPILVAETSQEVRPNNSDHQKRCKSIVINVNGENKTLYVDSQWGIGNINEAIEVFEKKFGIAINKIS